MNKIGNKADKTTILYQMDKVKSLGEKKKKKLIKTLFDQFFKHLNASSLILEIGTGRGEFAEESIQRGYNYIGIEPSESLYTDLITKNFQVINSRVPPLKFPDDHFDLVYSFDVLEHLVDYSEALTFINESKRVIKKGGLVCIIAPNFSTLGSMFFEYEYQHSYITTIGRIKKMFYDVGLEVTHQSAFLISPTKRLFLIDRLFAYTVLPIVRQAWITGLFSLLKLENLLFRVRKNFFDHIIVIGQKPF